MPETNAAPEIWRVLDLINWTTNYLESKGFPSPRTDVEWLLTSVLECSRVELYTNFEKPLTSAETGQFKQLLNRRLNHEPVQYIIGETEFMGLPFQVNPSVLIPRPETEILVENAIDWLRARPEASRKILDIGTGSGCIAVSLARFVEGCEVVAIDVSEDALAVARKNADINQVADKITFQALDILTEDPPEIPYDLIVSNPPYIAEDEFDSLEKNITEFEPREALLSENSGLLFYRHFAEKFSEWLQSGGQIFVEIGGTHQSESVKQFFAQKHWNDIRFIKDYNGQDRVLTTHL